MEISERLVDLEVTRAGEADIIVVSVDSPSREFARDFANVLVEERLQFREEQTTQTQDAALLMLTRAIDRLSGELKINNERMASHVRENGNSPVARLRLREMRADRERLQKLLDGSAATCAGHPVGHACAHH